VHNLAIRFFSRLPHTLMRIHYKQMCTFITLLWGGNTFVSLSHSCKAFTLNELIPHPILHLLYHTSNFSGLLIYVMWLLTCFSSATCGSLGKLIGIFHIYHWSCWVPVLVNVTLLVAAYCTTEIRERGGR
jgi:hypothetical protein